MHRKSHRGAESNPHFGDAVGAETNRDIRRGGSTLACILFEWLGFLRCRWILSCWVEFTGLKGQSGDAIVTTIGRNYVYSAEGVDLNDGANLAVDRDGLADGGFRGIHAVFTG